MRRYKVIESTMRLGEVRAQGERGDKDRRRRKKKAGLGKDYRTGSVSVSSSLADSRSEVSLGVIEVEKWS